MHGLPRPARLHALWLSAGGVWLMTVPSCDYNSYPIDPTFCDDWCRATMRADCDDDRPDSCVGSCEQSFDQVHCLPELRALAGCYSAASDEDFSCSPVETSIPKPDTCIDARDAWLDCEAPDIYDCVEFCRPLYEPGVQRLARECPQLVPDLTCADLCWSGVRLDELNTESVLRCFIDVLTRCEPVSRSASQSIRDYCDDAVKAGRYGAAGAGGGAGAGPM